MGVWVCGCVGVGVGVGVSVSVSVRVRVRVRVCVCVGCVHAGVRAWLRVSLHAHTTICT